MPIPVTCPSCSTGFSVNDELAVRADCPACGQSVAVPGRPVLVSRAKPAATADVAAPIPMARRDEGDRPRRRDDDDDRPRRRRRQDDSPPKRNGTLVGVLIFIGMLLLLVVLLAVAAVVWGYNLVQAVNSGPPITSPQKWADNQKLTAQAVRGVHHGMMLPQVEVFLGPAVKADADDLRKAAAGIARRDDVTERWTAKVDAGLVYRWTEGNDICLAAFSSDPATGGRVVGVLFRVYDTPTEGQVLRQVKNHFEKTPDAIEVTAATLTKEFAEDPKAAEAKYADKLVKVTGMVSEKSAQGDGIKLAGYRLVGQGGQDLVVDCRYAPATAHLGIVYVGHPATVFGKVQRFVDGNTLTVVDAKVLMMAY